VGDIWEGREYEKGGESEGVNLGFKPAGRSVHQRVHLESVFRVLFFFFLKTYHKAEIRLGGSFVAGLTITAITLKTVFNYLFKAKNVLHRLGAAAAAVDFPEYAALSRRVQSTRQKRSDRGRAAGKIKSVFLKKKIKLFL